MKKSLRTKSSNNQIIKFLMVFGLFAFLLSGCQQGVEPTKNTTNAVSNTTANTADTNKVSDVKSPVTVYEGADFTKASDEFSELGKIITLNKNVKNDAASSVKVAGGYKVTLFENSEGTGKQVVVDGDTEYDVPGSKGWANLSKMNITGLVSNLKIEKKNAEPNSATQISNTSPMAPAHVADSCDSPADNEVIIYEHIFSQDGGGKCVKLKPGEYKNAAAIGLADNIMSSIKVGVNVRATVCDGENFTPPCEDFDKTDDDLTNNATIKNDTVSSIKVIETKAVTAEAKPAEIKALATGLAGDWTDGNEIVKFTEDKAEFKLINQDKPYNTTPYKVVDGKTVEFTDDGGKANKAIMTFEDNGNTLIWYRPDTGQTFRFKRATA